MPGSVFNDNSKTIQTQINVAGEASTTAAPSQVSEDSPIRLSEMDGAKVNLLRVAIAMYRKGYFLDKSGRDASQSQVLHAFLKMVGADCANPYNDLTDNLSNGSTVVDDLFEGLKEEFKAYQQEKIEKAAKRR